jgi:hypothetical protein
VEAMPGSAFTLGAEQDTRIMLTITNTGKILGDNDFIWFPYLMELGSQLKAFGHVSAFSGLSPEKAGMVCFV